MQQADSPSQSSRLDDVAAVSKALIKEPVREAVREALEEQRFQIQGESGEVTVQPTGKPDEETEGKGESGKGMSTGKKALGLILGLALVSFLLRRRKKVLEAEPVSDVLGRSGDETPEDVEAENFENEDVEDAEGVSYDQPDTGTEAAVEDR